MPTTQIEIIKEVYAAINRYDIPGALKFFHPDILRTEPDFPPPNIYRGLDEMKAHLIKGRDSWAEGGCDPERFLMAGDKVIVFLQVRVRLKNKVEWIEGRLADGFAFQNGKIIEMHTFTENKKALEWAGIKE